MHGGPPVSRCAARRALLLGFPLGAPAGTHTGGSPECARATAAALRAVGVDRSVEDVTRLVALLTRPPRDTESADEAIRAVAEQRPVAEVTRLLALLHRTPLEPHCGQEAVRAAAAGRPVAELVELIGRLAEEKRRQEHEEPPGAQPGLPKAEDPVRPAGTGPGAIPARPVRPPRSRATVPSAGPPSWPGRLAAVALLVCAVLGFPPHRDDASPRAYGLALAVSALCVLLALLLTVRPAAVQVLAVAVLVPATLAAAQLFEGRFHSPGLSHALDLPLAPDWPVGTAAVCAALTALLTRLAGSRPASPAASDASPSRRP